MGEIITDDQTIQKVKNIIPNSDILEMVTDLFKVLGDETRTRILSVLSTSNFCVGDLANILEMTKSAISHQLHILKKTRLIKSKKTGREVIYAIADDHVAKIYQMAIEHVTEKR